MAMSDDTKKLAKPLKKSDASRLKEPEWTSGLKRIYDNVVDEPLPDSFKDLLSKLDENEDG